MRLWENGKKVVPKPHVEFKKAEIVKGLSVAGDCSIVAFSQAFGMPYGEILSAMTKEEEYPATASGGVSMIYLMQCMKAAGCVRIPEIRKVNQIPRTGKYLIQIKHHITLRSFRTESSGETIGVSIATRESFKRGR